MMSLLPTIRLGLCTRLVAGTAFLGLSAFFLAVHADAVRAMRETGLPAAVQLPVLEQRMRILKEQNEIAELQAALASGSAQEMLEVYALPSGTDTVRTLATFDLLFSLLQKDGDLSTVSPVTVGTLETATDGTTVLPLSFTAHMTRDGWKRMQLFTDVSGLLTVGDTIDQQQFSDLLTLTEQENPATVAALEQFFSVDLLRYAENPRPFHEALQKAFATDAAREAVRAFIDGPRLQAVRDLLAPLAPALRASRLWPLQFLQLHTVSHRLREDGMVDVEVKVGAYGRTNR